MFFFFFWNVESIVLNHSSKLKNKIQKWVKEMKPGMG